MMNSKYNIAEIVYLLCKKYPYKKELSRSRLTKLVYLVDLDHYRKFHKLATEIDWKYDNHGPFTWDVHEAAQSLHDTTGIIDIEEKANMFGSRKMEYVIRDGKEMETASLDKTIIACIDSVIEETKQLNYNDFIKYVYKTAPMENAEQYYELDFSKVLLKENKPKLLSKLRELARKINKHDETIGEPEANEDNEKKLFDIFKDSRRRANEIQ